MEWDEAEAGEVGLGVGVVFGEMGEDWSGFVARGWTHRSEGGEGGDGRWEWELGRESVGPWRGDGEGGVVAEVSDGFGGMWECLR